MLYTFLISIVFIAEIIIAIALMVYLINLDKLVNEYNEVLVEIQPSVKEISILARKISEQWVELAERFAFKLEQKRDDFVLKSLSKVLIGMLLWKANVKTINKFRKSKFAKVLGKGLSLLETMV